MSGFVGILNRGGRPIERPLLAELTESMAHCGPDHRGIWSDGPAGLGHALLAHRPDPPAAEHGPCSLDGSTWIAADARIDGQRELIARLRAAGRDVAAATPDARLILHAYAAWGERCLDRLIGDFAFALWDGERRRLLCARDHFGVVPLYYAPLGESTVVGNVLSALRRHPGVSAALDERAIGDYLLFGMKMDHADTTFADIRAVPPGHVVDGDRTGRRRVAPWWAPPPVAEPRAPVRPEERVERFRELFDAAVSDRLRSPAAGTHLSGGMDSTSIAATAKHVLAARGGEHELRAYVIGYDKLFAEEEGRYAQLVADHIGVPLEHLVADEYLRRPAAGAGDWRFPEPGIAPNQSTEYEISRRVASFSRALLVGFGGDPLLRGAPVRSPAWRRLARRALRRDSAPSFAAAGLDRAGLRAPDRAGRPLARCRADLGRRARMARAAAPAVGDAVRAGSPRCLRHPAARDVSVLRPAPRALRPRGARRPAARRQAAAARGNGRPAARGGARPAQDAAVGRPRPSARPAARLGPRAGDAPRPAALARHPPDRRVCRRAARPRNRRGTGPAIDAAAV